MEELATLAGGCFWCTESIFLRLTGVITVVSGYTGGSLPNPSYEDVCSGKTGHAEAIQITFDPMIIPYETLLEIFFHLHDPTTKNQQGADIGTQYRSVIFYHTESQRITALAMIQQITNQKLYPGTIITDVVPVSQFFPAESYHQRYYEKNSYAPYCQAVIDPKVLTLLTEFGNKVKKEYRV